MHIVISLKLVKCALWPLKREFTCEIVFICTYRECGMYNQNETKWVIFGIERKRVPRQSYLFNMGITWSSAQYPQFRNTRKNIQINTTARDIREKKKHTQRLTKSTLNTNIFVKFAFVDSWIAAEFKIRWHAHDIQWFFFKVVVFVVFFFGYFQCSFGVHVMCVLFDIYIQYILKEVKCNAYVMQLIDLFSFAFKWTLYVKYAIIIVFTIKCDNFKCFIYMN